MDEIKVEAEPTPAVQGPNFYVPRRTPFRRAIMKFKELAWIRQQPREVRAALLARVKPYRGRGKNHNYPFIKRIETGHVRIGAKLFPVQRSKYFPHQGKREMARRAA